MQMDTSVEEKSLLERLRCEGYFLPSFFMYVVRFCSFHGEDGFSMYVDRFSSFHGGKWFRLELLSNNNHTKMTDSLFEIYLYLWRIFCRQIFLPLYLIFPHVKQARIASFGIKDGGLDKM